jgi:hypothetical protein
MDRSDHLNFTFRDNKWQYTIEKCAHPSPTELIPETKLKIEEHFTEAKLNELWDDCYNKVHDAE